jgi:hypothetical protein
LGFRLEDQVRRPGSSDEEDQGGVGPGASLGSISSGVMASAFGLAGVHQRRTAEDLEQAVGEAVQVEQQIRRQRMPERHAAEHQDDDRDDDPEIEEEIWDEGIQWNESMEYRVRSMDDTGRAGVMTKGSAK